MCPYSFPISIDRRSYDPDTEEPEAFQQGLKWPVRDENLMSEDVEFARDMEEHEGRYSANSAFALKRALSEAGLAAGTLGFDDPRVLKWMNDMGLPDLKGIEATNIFREIRMVKSAAEIEILTEAGKRNEAAMNTAIDALAVGVPLEDIRHAHRVKMAEQGGHTVYILATQRGTPDGHVRRGELIMLDALSEYCHYHGDIGRTALAGEPTREMLKRNQAMAIGCEIAYDMIRPGVTGQAVTERIIDGMAKAGFPGFIIATPHSVGLEHTDHPLPIGPELPGAHGDFLFLENIVFTIDMPYHEIGWGGMHLEDMLRVTKDGCEPITSLDTRLRVQPG